MVEHVEPAKAEPVEYAEEAQALEQLDVAVNDPEQAVEQPPAEEEPAAEDNFTSVSQ